MVATLNHPAGSQTRDIRDSDIMKIGVQTTRSRIIKAYMTEGLISLLISYVVYKCCSDLILGKFWYNYILLFILTIKANSSNG